VGCRVTKTLRASELVRPRPTSVMSQDEGPELVLCMHARALREHGPVPLSEDEQRVLDEIERQLRLETPRRDISPNRTDGTLDLTEPGVPGPMLAIAVVLALVVVVLGVLAGGVLGLIVSVAGFVALVLGGVAIVRNSQARLLASLEALASRYQGPPSGPDRR
jgi:Protein of unknown function (DUF3040)